MPLTKIEIESVQDSWRKISSDGPKTTGLILMEKLFNTYPASIAVFSHLGIPSRPAGAITVSDLASIGVVSNHAVSLASRIGKLVGLLNNEKELQESSIEVGRIHVKYGVTSEHVDLLGSVLLSVISENQGLSNTSELIGWWSKTWNIIGNYVKTGLLE
ncbi:globin, polymeric component P2-like [Ciona intestinalis]